MIPPRLTFTVLLWLTLSLTSILEHVESKRLTRSGAKKIEDNNDIEKQAKWVKDHIVMKSLNEFVKAEGDKCKLAESLSVSIEGGIKEFEERLNLPMFAEIAEPMCSFINNATSLMKLMVDKEEDYKEVITESALKFSRQAIKMVEYWYKKKIDCTNFDLISLLRVSKIMTVEIKKLTDVSTSKNDREKAFKLLGIFAEVQEKPKRTVSMDNDEAIAEVRGGSKNESDSFETNEFFGIDSKLTDSDALMRSTSASIGDDSSIKSTSASTNLIRGQSTVALESSQSDEQSSDTSTFYVVLVAIIVIALILLTFVIWILYKKFSNKVRNTASTA